MEIAHLENIRRKLDKALLDAKANVARMDENYRDMKRYMVQNRGELDPHEMFQNELGLKQIDSSAFAAKMQRRIEKIKDSPYFARIDFRRGNDTEPEVFYIGRFAFSHNGILLISDWRAPVASMFYDCELGPAAYDAPMGRIEGELVRKRQFKIKNGLIEYTLESSVNIQDDVLQRELSHNSDEKMKSIIATIQKEQNQIIRNEKAVVLIIQGVAGSGKTSIALHRAAFLLYRQRDRLAAENVTIISPNKVFGDYISGVLPELGEEPICGLSLAEIAKVQLDGIIGFETDKDPLAENDAGWERRARFKSGLSFVALLEEYLMQIPGIAFEAADYCFGGFTETAERISVRFMAYGKYPVKRRLEMMAEDIYERFVTDNFMGEDLPKSRSILKALRQMLKVKDSLALYKEFYARYGIRQMFTIPAKKTLEWDDVYPFLYVQSAFEGLRESGVVRHLLIDEMQDYTPVQYAVLNVLFKCPKTIFGDFGQALKPNHLHSVEDLRKLYGGAEYAELTKSYRSSYEIICFARNISDKAGNAGTIEPIERHGEAPSVIKCLDAKDELAHIKTGIGVFRTSAYSSLGIIVKTNADAKELYNLLSPDCDVHLISSDSTRFAGGVSVASIQMCKGLEFDEVILPQVNSGNYSTKYDAQLLYIACTRAMHRLTLLYEGEASGLLGL